MKDFHYKIHFYSDWHCGSGLAAGADVDALVIKDKLGMPFIPGKTIKGLVREALEDIMHFKNQKYEDLLNQALGYFDRKETVVKGKCFFSDAVLDTNLYNLIHSQNLQNGFYRSISSTSIKENGVARPNSLRRIQVTIPCELYGEVLNVPEEFVLHLTKAFGYIKRIGLNRNRGLGRCYISLV